MQLQDNFEMCRRELNEKMHVKHIFSSPQQVRDCLCLKLGTLMREVFMVLFLDAQDRIVMTEEMFRGMLMQTSI